MDNVKTITAREIKQIASTFYEQPKYIMWHGKRIYITPLLEFKDFFDLVGDIVTHCVKDSKVIVESVDFIFKAKSIEKYGNLSLPKDIDEQYRIIYDSDLVKTIFNEVNTEQLDSLKGILRVYTGIIL